MNDKILCCILNYNQNEKAIAWCQRLAPHFDCLILDSGSNPPCRHEHAVNLPNIYYSGLMNEAYRRCEEGGYGWLMVVTSDIEIDEENTAKLVQAMKKVSRAKNIAMYQPCCRWSRRGRALHQSMCHFTGRMRCVNFQEGWFHLVRADIAARLFPVDTRLNLFGWGVDVALCHFARISGDLIIVDDGVKVLHPKGTGYNREEAMRQMRTWHNTIPGFVSPRHFRANRAPIEYYE